MVKYLGEPTRKWLTGNRRQIKAESCSSLSTHKDYNRDYFRRVACAEIFKCFMAVAGNSFHIIGRLAHTRDHKLQVALVTASSSSVSELAELNRALEEEISAWVKVCHGSVQYGKEESDGRPHGSL